jgi:hypothetical protein
MLRWRNSVYIVPVSLISIGSCLAILIWTSVYPFGRIFVLTAFDYNEGWNVYYAQKVAEHQLLYPSSPAWTTLNYPALSFRIVAALSRFTSEYLFTARILSLASLCLMSILVGTIVWHVTRSRLSSYLSAAFVIAFFCAYATNIVGMDDPQMLAQVFFLAGVYVYMQRDRIGIALELSALLFVLGCNIKHNLVEFPLAVFLDLLFSSRRRTLRFVLDFLVLGLASVFLTIRFEGGAYLSCLLIPRSYSIHKAILSGAIASLSMLLPLIGSLWIAPRCWKRPSQRVLVLLFFSAWTVDTIFSGGEGVDINVFFGLMLAATLLTGLFWAELPNLPRSSFFSRNPAVVCAIFFFSLAFDMAYNHYLWPPKHLEDDHKSAQSFAIESEFISKQPGPAICEDLLVCAYAGKPYIYDTFAAYLYMREGGLNPTVIVEGLRRQEFGAIQFWGVLEQIPSGNEPSGRLFPPAIWTAIHQYYRPGLVNEDGVIYVPKNLSGDIHKNPQGNH